MLSICIFASWSKVAERTSSVALEASEERLVVGVPPLRLCVFCWSTDR
jgi:hypothetical protein